MRRCCASPSPTACFRAAQLRKLADIGRRYDRGYGHFSTRQNMQFNWPKLEDVCRHPGRTGHGRNARIQTSGNCIRNITTDQFAGVAPDEIVDPRPYCELLRQWSTFHPEFAFLPRKFKIAVKRHAEDRAVTGRTTSACSFTATNRGEVGFTRLVGGGLGRTPILGR
jgi:sulfite reductase (NADPH) hemoprotein beta-component